jgi:hypothetical protein
LRTELLIGPQFSCDDKKLLARAGTFEQCRELSECSQPKLQEISRAHGLDFATALLFDRLLNHSEHSAFFKRVQSASEVLSGDGQLVGIVPGAFYREHKNTGADGARVAAILKSMGCKVEIVPLESFGSLKRNAELIAQWLREKKNRPLVLITLSKGAADLKTALALPNAPELFRHVQTWISLSGLPQGTPLAGWLRTQRFRQLGIRILLRLRGQRYSVVEELRHGPGSPVASWPPVPAHLQIIHVMGFPLRKHLAHPWAARGYQRIAPLGPNDGGGFLLSDVVNLPGTVLPVWGADHYLQPGWDATSLLRRVFAMAMAAREAFLQTAQSAAQPINPPASKSIA